MTEEDLYDITEVAATLTHSGVTGDQYKTVLHNLKKRRKVIGDLEIPYDNEVMEKNFTPIQLLELIGLALGIVVSVVTINGVMLGKLETKLEEMDKRFEVRQQYYEKYIDAKLEKR